MFSIQLVVVTTDDLVRSGIQMLIQATPSIEMVEALSDIQSCEDYVQQHRVHVLLIDDTAPGYLSPRQVLTTLRQACPTLSILILSEVLSENYVQRLIQYGASGFIYKRDRLKNILVLGIQTIVDGHVFLSPQAAVLPYASGYGLSGTELEVLKLIAYGYTVKEISARIGLAKGSVYRIRDRLHDYLEVRTNEQLVEAAHRRGLL